MKPNRITYSDDQKETDRLITSKDHDSVGAGRPCAPQCRYVLAAMTFLCLAVSTSQRASFNVALVAMVNFTYIDVLTNESEDVCHNGLMNDATEIPKLKQGEFDWDGDVQSHLLASFFYGYVFSQVFGGYLGERYGMKLVMGLATFIPSLLYLIMPVLARWDVSALIAVRALAGVISGPTVPLGLAMWGRWAPYSEQTSLAAMTAMGANAGIMMSAPLAGLVCDSGVLGGWPAVFVIFGLLGCVWFIVWCLVIYDSPSDHPYISKTERIHIEATCSCLKPDQVLSIPWTSIMTSLPVWAMNVSYLCDSIGYYMVLNAFPLYLREVLKYDVQANGLIISAIYLADMIFTVLGGIAADQLTTKSNLNISTMRTVFSVGAHGGAAIGCVGVALLPCDRIWAVFFMVFSLGFRGLWAAGFAMTPLDIAPRYASTLAGIGNGLGNVGGFLSPVLANLITHGKAAIGEWQSVFYMVTGLYVVSVFVQLFFSSSEQQSWAHPRDQEGHKKRYASPELSC